MRRVPLAAAIAADASWPEPRGSSARASYVAARNGELEHSPTRAARGRNLSLPPASDPPQSFASVPGPCALPPPSAPPRSLCAATWAARPLQPASPREARPLDRTAPGSRRGSVWGRF
jgi:hypothetical protein